MKQENVSAEREEEGGKGNGDEIEKWLTARG